MIRTVKGNDMGSQHPSPTVKNPEQIKIARKLDGGQITHPIRVRLKILLYDSFWGGSGFPVFSFPFLSCSAVITYVLDIPRAISTGNVQNIRRQSYDSKTGWAPIRCVFWRWLKSGLF